MAAKDAAKPAGDDPLLGRPAPDVSLYDQEGKAVDLADFRGQHVVLYFYPKDLTTGCTVQACQYNDSLAAYRKTGAVVFGVSPDDAKSHQKFIAKHSLGFPLLFDPSRKALEAFGVWKEKSMYGRAYMGIERSTFVLGPDGKVVAAWRKVQADGDAARVLEFLRAQAKRPAKA